MYTPVKRQHANEINEMAVLATPNHSTTFMLELRQALQERNMLTEKTKKKVCSMLMDNNSRTPQRLHTEMYKRQNFRLQAIEEIIVSEKAYLQQLKVLMDYFVKPLKEQRIIDEVSHMTLFGQIEMIYNLNEEFLRELQSDMNNVANAFLRMAPFFKLYSVYAFDYRQALLIMQELTSNNSSFRKFLQLNESRPEVQRKLNSLMIVPIQRIPRYKLLLEQVLLYTSPADGDYKLLKESVTQIEHTVSHINSCVADQETTQKLIFLQNSLVDRTPNIVKPSRKVIKEGILNKITRNGNAIKRYCVLMSDIFMYCKILKYREANTIVENALECCCIFPLNKCKIYELLPGNFKITCQGDGIIFSAGDLQNCRTWLDFIRDAIDLYIQCRQTLRKESSKRKPLRKKDIKQFGGDYMLSPKNKKSDFESIFRNRNRLTFDGNSDDDDGDNEDENIININCFGKNKTKRKSIETFNHASPKKIIKLTLSDVETKTTIENRTLKYVLKQNQKQNFLHDHDNDKQNLKTQVNNNLQISHNTILRVDNESSRIWNRPLSYLKENIIRNDEPQKKRVKFNETTTNVLYDQKSCVLQYSTLNRNSFRDKINNFFNNLFF